MSCVEGLERTLKALEDRLGESDEALVALARGLAKAVDAEPKNGALWREYRAAVSELRSVGADGSDDDTAWILQFRPGRAQVGDSAN